MTEAIKTKVAPLVGAKVKCVRRMTFKEMDAEGWVGYRPFAIEFENGIVLFPSRDEEGNGPGCIYGSFKGVGFWLTEEK